eukprot:6472669-Amphidinium_carterae.1
MPTLERKDALTNGSLDVLTWNAALDSAHFLVPNAAIQEDTIAQKRTEHDPPLPPSLKNECRQGCPKQALYHCMDIADYASAAWILSVFMVWCVCCSVELLA